jgi:hypothetical protein
MKDFGLNGSICAGASVPSLGYNGIVPGPLMQRTQCVTHCCLVYPMLHTSGTSTVHRSHSLSHLAPAFHPAFLQPPQSPCRCTFSCMAARPSTVNSNAMLACRGIPHVARFTNRVSPTSKYFPPAGPGNAGSEGVLLHVNS